ncbi:MAG TPA: CHAT domain-containing protein [Blastocatellia bacterium]
MPGTNECTVTLSIQSTGAEDKPSVVFHIGLNGSPVKANLQLSPEEWQEARELSTRFNELFEQRGRPKVASAGLTLIGDRLFELWLAPAWQEIGTRLPAGTHTTLLIATPIPEALNLPWELLRLPGRDFIGFDRRFSVRRLPRFATALPAFAGELPAGPPRVLFMACAPLDLAQLDFDKEEEYLVRAVAGPNVHFYAADLGSFEELGRLIAEFDPHIVHLSGHGAVKEGLGYFAFEDMSGANLT